MNMNVERALTNVRKVTKRFPSIWAAGEEWIVLLHEQMQREGRSGRLMMLDKGDNTRRYHRYVTCWIDDDVSVDGWTDGHTFAEFRAAEADFFQRFMNGS